MPNAAPKRHKGPAPRGGGKRHAQALHREGALQTAQRTETVERSISTAALRRLPDAKDAVEIQAYLLRREGHNYADIQRLLEVGREMARTLVAEGAKVCVDEDPVTSLRLHLGRLEALVGEWFPRAFAQPVSSEAIVLAQSNGLPNPEHAETVDARRNTELVLKVLAMQQDIGTWLAGLPRRGQERKEDDDHREIKEILMRADEYREPAPFQADAPHGLPHLGWRPEGVEDAPRQDPRPGDAPQAPGASEAKPRPWTSPLW